jgi:diacylglycerol kinase family enzyme
LFGGSFNKQDTVDALESALQADPALAELALEFSMAKKALDSEYRRNAHTILLNFGSSSSKAADSSLSVSTDAGLECQSSDELELSSDSTCDCKDTSLWAHPPCGSEKPSCVAVVIGCSVIGDRDRIEVATYLSEHGVEASFWSATSSEEERRLARTIPHRYICVLGDRSALRQVIAGLMDRDDQEDIVLGILPSESLCMSTTDEMGISTARDGMEKVIAGQVRAMDLLKFEDLTPGASKKVVYGMSHVDWGMSVAAVSSSQGMSKVLGASAKTITIYGGVIKNASYPATVEIPADEAPNEYVKLLANERRYHGINVYNSKTAIMGTQRVLCSANAQLDDGLMELTVKRFGSRAEFAKNSKKVLVAGEFDSTYAADSWNSLVQVSSVIVRPAPCGTAKCHSGPNSVIVDRDIVGGSPYKISVAQRALKIFV